MRFQKAIKRMIALGTGAIMVGSSVFAAADLASYPMPFVKDGKFSGVLIVGNKAAAEDVIGISDIISSLQFAATKKVSTTSGGEVSFEGDAWKVGYSSRILELSENLDSGTNRESIATITSSSFIDDSEMPGLLAKGKTTNTKGDADYDQRLYFNDTTTGYVEYTENDDDVTADFLKFVNDKPIARYELEFTTQLESDVDDSGDSASSTGTFLTDFEDTSLTMMGKPFEIVTARRLDTGGNNIKLTLMGGAVKDTMVEKQTKTYSVSGKDYEVTLSYVDSDEAQFVINGQTTRKLRDGDTDKLSDGTTVGISEILYQDYAGGIHSSTFFLGAQKMELRDSNITTAGTSSNDLKIDDETIDNAEVVIEGTDDDSTFKLDKISVQILADDDFWVPAGGKLSEAMKAEGSEPEALFTKNWDIEYKGLTKTEMSKIEVKSSGSDQYDLVFSDGRGNPARIPIAQTASGTKLRFGDDDDDLTLTENISIAKDDYFIVTDESDTDGERQTFALRYRGGDKPTADNPILKFDDLGSGERIERPITVAASQVTSTAVTPLLTQLGEIKLGGGTFRVYNTTSADADDYNIVVDLDASGGISGETTTLNTKEGAKIVLLNESGNIKFNISTPNVDDFDDLVPHGLSFNITASAGEVSMAESQNDINFRSPEGDDDNSYAYTAMGAWVKFFSPNSEPEELTVNYPKVQRVPLVYITGKSASFTETGVSSTDAVMVQRIQVGAAKLASEVSDVKAQNTILVGGPCANAAAATVMGNPVDCTTGFTPGEGMIQLWEHSNGNVAMLVAGYGAVDTRNAAAVVANYKDYKANMKGMKVIVKKVSNQLTVAAPAAMTTTTA